MLNDKFFSGREPLGFDENNLENPVNIEWYLEQQERAENGFTHNGVRITGDHYWFLNFNPIMRVILDKNGHLTDRFRIDYPFWCNADDYLFKQIEEAYQDKLGVMLFTSRGFGKTYLISSIGVKTYVLRDESHNMYVASNKKHVNETFNEKVIPTLNSLEKKHPTWRHKRIVDNNELIQAGEKVDYGTHTSEEGSMSKLEKAIMDAEGKLDGKRLDFILWEEIGSWGKNPTLRECITKSKGTYYVGGIKRCRDFYIGTGGSVLSDEAKEIMFNPYAYDLYVPKEHKDRPISIFIPAYEKLGSFYETKGDIIHPRTKEKIGRVKEDGINDNEAAKKYLEDRRIILQSEQVAYEKEIQQYPFTVEEVFLKSIVRTFASPKLSKQYVDVSTKLIEVTPERGNMIPEKDAKGNIVGASFHKDSAGKVLILEHPVWIKNYSTTKFLIKNDKDVLTRLYVSGIDSVDQDKKDSSSKDEDLSKVACLIKKRIDPNNPLNPMNNAYVALYLNRSQDSRVDYEQVALLHLYYNSTGLLEHTRIRIRDYFVEKGLSKFLAREPTHLSATIKNYKAIPNKIGIRVTTDIIGTYVECIKEYIEDYYDKLYFIDLLTQLTEYTLESKKKFDLVAAMGMCELIDNELRNAQPVATNTNNKVKQMSWYTDSNGGKVFGYKQNEF